MFFIRQGVVEVLNPDHDYDNKIDDIDPAPMK
jgi:NACalpha-BTF3-like transcription factor